MKLLTPEEVADQLGISRSSVRRMITEHQLPAACLRSGRRKKVWRIPEDELERWIRKKLAANGGPGRRTYETATVAPAEKAIA